MSQKALDGSCLELGLPSPSSPNRIASRVEPLVGLRRIVFFDGNGTRLDVSCRSMLSKPIASCMMGFLVGKSCKSL